MSNVIKNNGAGFGYDQNGKFTADSEDLVVDENGKLRVLNATNLEGTTEMTNSSAYRTTGGNEDVLFGTAQVLSVQGNSVAWNQLVKAPTLNKESNGVTISSNTDTKKITITGTAVYGGGRNSFNFGVVNAIKNHKVYCRCKDFIKASIQPTLYDTIDNSIVQPLFASRNEAIVTITTDFENGKANIGFNVVANVAYNVSDYLQYFDLTLIYGAGKEPTTQEQFEADYQRWFGKPLTYEEYDEGSIRSTQTAKTITWNQLVTNGNFANGITNWNIYGCPYSISKGELTLTPNENTSVSFIDLKEMPLAVQGHIYIACVDVYATETYNNVIQFNAGGSSYATNTKTNAWQRLSIIKKATNNTKLNIALYHKGSVANIPIKYRNIQLFDLTLIYGAGNEPTIVEEFETDYKNWFGKPLTYEEYDEGSVMSIPYGGIKTVGFNLVYVPDYSGSVADFVEKKKPNVTFFENNFGYQGSFVLSCDAKYDSAEKGLGLGLTIFYDDGSKQGKIIEDGHNDITTLGNVARIEWSYNKEKQISLSNFCLNMSWSGKRDGEYEPYWSETQPLPLTTLKGKLNGEGESVVVFPDGMKRAGSIYDEIKVENGVTKAVKRVGSVDLGTLNWNLYPSKNYSYYAYFQGAKSPTAYNVIPNSFTAKYQSVNYDSANRQLIDKSISAMQDNYPRSVACICDSSYIEDASALKQSLQDVILYYELAEPQEYIIDDFELPLIYRIDDFGTEQILQPENSIAPTIITKYGINAVDAIRRMPKNYISSISMDNFLAKLSEVMGGTWSKSWNESRGGYDFNFLPKEEEIAEIE